MVGLQFSGQYSLQYSLQCTQHLEQGLPLLFEAFEALALSLLDARRGHGLLYKHFLLHIAGTLLFLLFLQLLIPGTQVSTAPCAVSATTLPARLPAGRLKSLVSVSGPRFLDIFANPEREG